jgi:hypothetical protein
MLEETMAKKVEKTPRYVTQSQFADKAKLDLCEAWQLINFGKVLTVKNGLVDSMNPRVRKHLPDYVAPRDLFG